MAQETVKARLQVKDSAGNVQMDEEGKPIWREVECQYDFGDNLSHAIEMVGEDTVYTNYKANAKVALQGILRAKAAAGLTADAIQALVDNWKPGMVMEKTQVDPETAITNAFETWSPEKQAEFLAKLGVSR